jgi:hypothetical protein
MKRFDADALTNLPCLAMGRCFGDCFAVFATDDLQVGEVFELYGVVNIMHSFFLTD